MHACRRLSLQSCNNPPSLRSTAAALVIIGTSASGLGICYTDTFYDVGSEYASAQLPEQFVFIAACSTLAQPERHSSLQRSTANSMHEWYACTCTCMCMCMNMCMCMCMRMCVQVCVFVHVYVQCMKTYMADEVHVYEHVHALCAQMHACNRLCILEGAPIAEARFLPGAQMLDRVLCSS